MFLPKKSDSLNYRPPSSMSLKEYMEYDRKNVRKQLLVQKITGNKAPQQSHRCSGI